ncbi:MAG: Type secretion system domain protein [Cyanobacteria bacterium RYN_339]|nr:Type secretion system domain protein [Cyanobacteria bacterium RYN_339]
MMWPVLAGGFLTAACIAWGLSAASEADLGKRLLRYASRSMEEERVEGVATIARAMPAWLAFLEQAGVSWTPGQALAVLAVHGLVGLAIGLALNVPWLGFSGGLLLLYLRLRMGRARRTQRMAEQLPDAIMLLATALRSGFGFQQGLQLVAREGAAPLAPELGRLSTDMALGADLETALLRLQARMGTTDGEMLASALLVQRQTGGNLSEILVNLHETIRDRQAVHGQVRTLTAQGRLSGIVLTLIPVGIGLAFYVLNRDYLMTLVLDPRGRIMSGVCLVLMLSGIYMIKRIVTITL